MVLYFLQIFKYNLENLRKVSSSLYIFLLFLLFLLPNIQRFFLYHFFTFRKFPLTIPLE